MSVGAGIEAAMGAVVAGQRFPQIIGPIGIGRLRRHLAGISILGQVAIADAWQHFVSFDRHHGRRADEQLAAAMMGRPINRPRGDLGLINRAAPAGAAAADGF